MLHQDDIWLPDRAAVLRRVLAEAPDVRLVLHATRFIDAGGRGIGTWRAPLAPYPVRISSMELVAVLLVQNFVAVPATTFRTEDARAVGGVDPELWYTGDWDFYLRLAALGECIYLPRALAGFRIHPTSLTVSGSKDLGDFLRQLDIVFDRHIERLKDPQLRREAALLGRVSIDANLALAALLHGDVTHLPRWMASCWRAGFRRIPALLRATRLHERVFARLRAGLLLPGRRA